jgi:hypothetical protein
VQRRRKETVQGCISLWQKNSLHFIYINVNFVSIHGEFMKSYFSM